MGKSIQPISDITEQIARLDPTNARDRPWR
jgi:hypothetical protein